MENNLEKEQALENYFDRFGKIPQPVNGSCYGLASYTSKILAVIGQLYDDAYVNGFKDALNTDFEFKTPNK